MLVFFIFALVFAALALVAFRRLGQWNRSYVRLGERYCGTEGQGGVAYGMFFSKPSLRFDYGRTLCWVRSRRSFRFDIGRQTELAMHWPDRKFRLEIGTTPIRSRYWRANSMKPVVSDDPRFQSVYDVASNNPRAAKRLLTGSVQWQIEQLTRLPRNADSMLHDIQITIARGSMVISKPGYIKQFEALEDFVRLGLELFDHLMLADVEGIEFLHQNEATVVLNVKCPICSEEIAAEMVVCDRCKTPHCKDCWEYNGQCATFACRETRFTHAGTAAIDHQ